MKINGSIPNPRWKGIKCNCDHSSVETEFPIAECLHCKFQAQEDSMPRQNFEIEIATEWDKDGKTTKTEKKTIKEIKIVRCPKYEAIIGWTY